MKPFEYVKDEAGRIFLRYNEAYFMARWLQDWRGKEKNEFWFTEFWWKYSVNQNFSSVSSLLWWGHLAMKQASLYLKKILPASSLTYSKGFMISPSYPKIRGVKLFTWTVNHPVERQLPFSANIVHRSRLGQMISWLWLSWIFEWKRRCRMINFVLPYANCQIQCVQFSP